ncbi:MAG TPA: transcriptional regulator [Streptosporangiaceae bacterium]|nr:transcriptional regulator [Streptosporangiaceae bacterium]
MILPPDDADLASLSSLDDPVRGSLYEFVSGCGRPVGRDEAAAAVGIGRALAVYHLDKLVQAGLLSVTYQRLAGRSGPGAGRPAKLYTRSGREFAVSVPPREYELAARLLVQAVGADQTGQTRAALDSAARQLGTQLAVRHRAGPPPAPDTPSAPDAPDAPPAPDASPTPHSPLTPQAPGGRPAAPAGPGTPRAGARRDLAAMLQQHGFEPFDAPDGAMRLRNCPFHQLAQQDRSTVCGMNLALVDGMITGLGTCGLHPVLDPQPGNCCVAIRQQTLEA